MKKAAKTTALLTGLATIGASAYALMKSEKGQEVFGGLKEKRSTQLAKPLVKSSRPHRVFDYEDEVPTSVTVMEETEEGIEISPTEALAERRAKVKELYDWGWTEDEISTLLELSLDVVFSDLQTFKK